MKFLIDAHLPRQLARQLQEMGFDTIHTLDLPLKNRTPDTIIEQISLREQRVVVTKDADFVNTFTIHQRPYKLLLVSTGNISNADLGKLFLDNIEHIARAFEEYSYVEIDRTTVTLHQ